MIKEFKEFISRGNLVDLAVAFIMGLTFAAVVTAFTNIILGAVAYAFGAKLAFSELGVHRGDALVIPIGAFLLALINFIVVAVVLFLIVKMYNRLMRKEEAESHPTEIDLLTQIRDELARR
jgi:large conductance mechanosensitive channel